MYTYKQLYLNKHHTHSNPVSQVHGTTILVSIPRIASIPPYTFKSCDKVLISIPRFRPTHMSGELSPKFSSTRPILIHYHVIGLSSQMQFLHRIIPTFWIQGIDGMTAND
jgi:hypothetical protein